MTTVTIKIDEISAAITAMEDLSSEVTSQAGVARSASPIGLPSLSESTLGKKTRWLDDHLEDLTTRRDLAILLDTEGTGTASYTVTSDTLTLRPPPIKVCGTFPTPCSTPPARP